jgi:hypothetical protein
MLFCLICTIKNYKDDMFIDIEYWLAKYMYTCNLIKIRCYDELDFSYESYELPTRSNRKHPYITRWYP